MKKLKLTLLASLCSSFCLSGFAEDRQLTTPSTNEAATQKVEKNKLHPLANTDMTTGRPAYKQSADAAAADDFDGIQFKVVFNRLDVGKVGDENIKYKIPKDCDNSNYIAPTKLFDLNKTPFPQRHAYLTSKELKKCRMHWYGADVTQVKHTLGFFETNEFKAINNTKPVDKLRNIFTRTYIFKSSVENFNKVFNTKLKYDQAKYAGPLKVKDKKIADAILGIPSLKWTYDFYDDDNGVTRAPTKIVPKNLAQLKRLNQATTFRRLGQKTLTMHAEQCQENSPICKIGWSTCTKGSYIEDGSCRDKATMHSVELAKLYDFPENHGQGQHIAIIAPFNDYNSASKHHFNQYVNAIHCDGKSKDECDMSLKVHQRGTDQHNLGGEGEFDLDLSVIASIVPKATLYLSSMAADDTNTTYDMFEHSVRLCTQEQRKDITTVEELYNCNPVNIISASYGNLGSENYIHNVFNSLMEDAALNNTTFSQASGDLGSSNKYFAYEETDKPTYLYTTSSPYATSVGGSSPDPAYARAIYDERNQYSDNAAKLDQLNILDDKFLRSIQDMHRDGTTYTWNDLSFYDIPEPGSFLHNAVSSGGATAYARPSYQRDFLQLDEDLQTAYFAQCDGGLKATGCYLYPDMSLPGGGAVWYLMLHTAGRGDNPKIVASAGTSASAPLFAAMVARINTELNDAGIPGGVGFINPLLYKISDLQHNEKTIKDDQVVFKDVTGGDNCTIFNKKHLQQWRNAKNNSDNEGNDYDKQMWAKTLCFGDPENRLYKSQQGQYDTASGLGEVFGNPLKDAILNLYHADKAEARGPTK